MKISLKWLNDFVDVTEFNQTPEKLSALLTRAGLEVEEMQNKSQDLKNVVIGFIQTKEKHPNSDKLSLCQVQVSSEKTEQIICGAQNHKAGDYVVVALPGAVLPGNFAIKKSKIRDVESNGMLCSFKELGLEGDSQGIIILNDSKNSTQNQKSFQIGQDYASFAGLDDVLFELKVTPNRADCLSHYGLAREISCLIQKPLKKIKVQTEFFSESTKNKISLEVLDSDLCPRYCGRYISGVKIQPSPNWLKSRLEIMGLNSINNVVDVTNYVMLEMGQPLHAFDADLISGSKIQVRKSKLNEPFKTLKEQNLELSGNELVIADSSKVLALAGVIGGFDSGVSDQTVNLFLESAQFKALPTRKSSRRFGIETDSAYRFSRGVDPSQTLEILDRATQLILEVAGGKAFDQAYDIYPMPITKKPITLHIQTLSDRLGYQAEPEIFVNFMQGLGCQVLEKIKGQEFEVLPPLFRFDLEQDMDLVEEYARLNGYEKIGETLPAFSGEPLKHDEKYMMQNKLGKFLQAEGFHQAMNFCFVSETQENQFLGELKKINDLGLQVTTDPVRLKNPLSEDLNIMRRSLSLGLWKNVVDNFHAGNESGQIYEIGSSFNKLENTDNTFNPYQETRKLALIIWGESFGLYADAKPCVLRLKSTLENLFQSLQISAFTVSNFINESQLHAPDFLHTGQSASITVEGKKVGYLGSLHPELLADAKIRVPVALLEINLEKALPQNARPIKFKSLSGFQPVERDFSFVMKSESVIGDLTKEIKKSVGAKLQDLKIFDIYEGEKLAAGEKSIALRLKLQSFEQALTETEINEISQLVIKSAEKSVGARLRSS